jgi:TPR repeat protein
MLGVLCSDGPSRNLKEAQIWYKKAAGKGHPGAIEALKQPKSAKDADNKVQKIIIAPANPPKI